MQEVTKRALKTPLKNCETKVAQAGFQWANQWANQRAGFQWANQRAGFQWNGVVLLGAVLLSLLFVGNLQAQSPNGNTKQGFFAGIVYLQGFGVDTTKTSTSSATGYEITGYSNDETRIDATSGLSYWDTPAGTTAGIGARALIAANCERDATNTTYLGENYYLPRNFYFFDSFDPGAKQSLADINSSMNDATVTFNDDTISSRIFRSGLVAGETSYCKTYFDSLPQINFSAYDVTPDSPSKPPVTSTESNALNGVGLQFGWRGEKWRASLTHFTGKGGANELVNTVVMAEYFFHEEFFVGGGLASMKLTNGSTSASATSPVITVGYKENLTPNLFFNISLTKYISGISLSRSTSPTATNKTFTRTQTERGKDSHKATIGSRITVPANRQSGVGAIFQQAAGPDNRIEVTQFRSRDVEIEEVTTPATQKIEAEIKAPVVVSISLLWRF